MARTKKKSPVKSSATKVNKTAWIRSQPATLSAKEVVETAKAEGITLSVAQVYTARSTGKKATAPVTPKAGKGPAKTRESKVSSRETDYELDLRRIVLSVGLPKVETYLADLKRSAGL